MGPAALYKRNEVTHRWTIFPVFVESYITTDRIGSRERGRLFALVYFVDLVPLPRLDPQWVSPARWLDDTQLLHGTKRG